MRKYLKYNVINKNQQNNMKKRNVLVCTKILIKSILPHYKQTEDNDYKDNIPGAVKRSIYE